MVTASTSAELITPLVLVVSVRPPPYVCSTVPDSTVAPASGLLKTACTTVSADRKSVV